MRKVVVGAVAALMLVSTGCYHAVVDTGLQPSGQTIEKSWAHGFVYGLVPPSAVETASRCTSGVAKVETKHSFLNQLASGLTWGLYTPMTISVECAAPVSAMRESSVSVPAGTGMDDAREILGLAAERAAGEGQAVYVTFAAE